MYLPSKHDLKNPTTKKKHFPFYPPVQSKNQSFQPYRAQTFRYKSITRCEMSACFGSTFIRVFFSLPSFQFSVIAATNYTTRCPTCTALNDAWRMNKYLKCKQFAPAPVQCAGSPKIVASLASVARSLFLSWGGIIKRSWIFPIVFHWQQHLSHLAEQCSTSLVFLLCPVSGLLSTALSRKRQSGPIPDKGKGNQITLGVFGRT